jgi:predicted TIM-barrel fold metal-dependent hydrolase
MALREASAATNSIPVIDTHIHLFDTNRPGGVPWPPKDNKALYKPALPERYRKLATPHGVVGAIEVEASPLLEDNQWILDVIQTDPIMVGTIGDLEPGKPAFAKQLDRFHKNRLFLGIRYGNLWGRDLHDELPKPEFIVGAKAIAEAGLTWDTANQTPRLIKDALHLTDKVPNLRVVLDHLPQMTPPTDPAAHRENEADLRELSKRPHVYLKLSSVLRRVDGKVPTDVNFYRPGLDELVGLFGPDHIVYGSDWPNSDNWGSYDQVFSLVHQYFTSKGKDLAEKYFWKNSIAAYRWVHRDPSQPKV